ncbi:MAG: helix-turn-helix domain-containing protein [Gemmataceae bacterium]
MRRLTLREVNEQHGGVLPPDAVFRPDDGEEPARPASAAKPKRRARSERFAALNAFTDFSLADLTGAEAKVWLILFRDTKGTGTARTGQADVARRAGIDARSVRRALASLEERGMVHVLHRGGLRLGPSVYRVRPTGAV